ncbi:acetyl-CoA carboxylase carboxyltransferase subunit alpha [Clostridium amylolyticum]|uniref:Acetyl-coenzyme A carboxylase carboxyl transferase subunit alpha n=1 Tax=Clostridium amylolyticum TaxID=1121298 RepID=A0A1M6CYZ0_9CLOT|nr:acetyl-CoA carboxylase carboxyltransferase subunit alpha [Clostridium amylolyticum]SHI66216.1 acetyl-CoA carboxylase carboxyltransferase subunit alpha [Clostridium amylolyticum]
MTEIKSAWDRVLLARHKNRPTAKYYIDNVFDDFIELHGDRYYGEDKAVMAGLAVIQDIKCTVVAQVKGENTYENIEKNFGMTHPEGYRKALRLMKQAEKFNRPIICFVDTPGAFCGIGAEERGQGEAIAKNLINMISLKVPIISIVIGEGGSGGALALSISDKFAMLKNSIYSILSPEGFASILWKDASRAKEAAEIMKLTAFDLQKYHIIDDIIKEPEGGAQEDPKQCAFNIRNYILKSLDELKKSSVEEVVNNRYKKFRNMDNYWLNQTPSL